MTDCVLGRRPGGSIARALCNAGTLDSAGGPRTTAGSMATMNEPVGKPQLVASTVQPAPAGAGGGAQWRLDDPARQLDANLIRLVPLQLIEDHGGPDLDVLIHVVRGSGLLGTDDGAIDLEPGAVVWLPRRSRRGFAAGPDGLSYLSVHVRRPRLSVGPPA